METQRAGIVAHGWKTRIRDGALVSIDGIGTSLKDFSKKSVSPEKIEELSPM